MTNRKWFLVVTIVLFAAIFRIAVAHWLPNDAPDDGRVYAQMARNLLEQHVFSHDTQAPYEPSLIRLPGYPSFIAAIYSVVGHTNNGAVRVVQALIDTASCVLIALLAFYWQPDEKKRRTTAIAALALAALCPFTTIYAATILTEVPTMFLMLATFVAVTMAFRKLTTEDTEEDKNSNRNWRVALLWWGVAGLIGGLNVLFRPDSGLFVAAAGLTLVIGAFRVPTLVGLSIRKKSPTEVATLTPAEKRRRRLALPAHSKKTWSWMVMSGAIFSLAFVIVLAPWTIRNWRVFHIFQPLSPAHGEMPGEFVPRGYYQWLRTWLDDESYVAPFLWSLDTDPIDIDDVPKYAFDSPEERDRVAALLDKYNNPDGSPEPSPTPSLNQPKPSPSPTSTPSRPATLDSKVTKPKPSPAAKQGNSNANASEDTGDKSDAQGDEEDSGDEPEESQTEKPRPVEMTPEIDAGFAQLARERIARRRLQFYVLLPLKRAHTMWFDTHSQYWPFEGTLLPLEDLDYEGHQQYWLPLFAGLTALYTLLGLAGAWFLWAAGEFEARQWLLLTVLAIVLRLVLFSSIENPEPRYTVEFFPLLSILGGIAIAQLPWAKKKQEVRG